MEKSKKTLFKDAYIGDIIIMRSVTCFLSIFKSCKSGVSMVKRVLSKNMLFVLVFFTFSVPASDELTYAYNTESEDNTSYTGKVAIENPNTSYTWNGSYFAVRDISNQ